MTPAAVLAQFNIFLALKDQAFGAIPVFYVAIKPSVRRWSEFESQTGANALVSELAASREDLTYIDIVSGMLEEGRPRAIFLADQLHMTADGYAIWTMAIKPVLQAITSPAPSVSPPR